jgi:hypothetical protein
MEIAAFDAARGSPEQFVTLELTRYRRSGINFFDALANSEELAFCRTELAKVGYTMGRDFNGAKFVCSADLLKPVVHMLRVHGVNMGGQRLYLADLCPRHVITCSTYAPIVELLLAKIPRSRNVTAAKCTWLFVCKDPLDEQPGEPSHVDGQAGVL